MYNAKVTLISREDGGFKAAVEKAAKYAEENNFYLNDLTFSPIKGKKEGNIEFLGLFTRHNKNKDINIIEIVEKSHKELE